MECTLLKKKDTKKEIIIEPKPVFVLAVICFIIIIITLYKIEIFKRFVDSQKQDNQLELEAIDGEENQEKQRKETALTYLIVLGIAFIVICGWFFIVLLKGSEDLFLKNLRTVTFTKIIIDNVIPIIIILRNDSMFNIFKCHVYQHFHIIHIFKRCLCPNNQIEPMIELNAL